MIGMRGTSRVCEGEPRCTDDQSDYPSPGAYPRRRADMPVTRRYAVASLAASGMVTASSGPLRWMLPDALAAAVRTGAPAPAFAGTDTKGVAHTLAAYRGKIVVLEWTNHECPYTAK